MLFAIFPSAPQFRNESRRNFGVVSAGDPQEALKLFKELIGANTVEGFTTRELIDDESFAPFLVECSHPPVGADFAEITSGGDRLN